MYAYCDCDHGDSENKSKNGKKRRRKKKNKKRMKKEAEKRSKVAKYEGEENKMFCSRRKANTCNNRHLQ